MSNDGCSALAANSLESALVSAADVYAGARAWFAAQGWSPFPFQEEVWSAFARGESGLLHAPTGMGKTLRRGDSAAACSGPRAAPTRRRR